MANECEYSACVRGEPKVVDELVAWMEDHTRELISKDVLSDTETEKTVNLDGYCRWSVWSAWNIEKYSDVKVTYEASATDDPKTVKMIELANKIHKQQLEDESILDIKGNYELEVYSSECGMGFAEHYIFKDGKILLDNCRDYSEFYDEEKDTVTLNGGFAYYTFKFDPTLDIPRYDNYIAN